MQAALTVRDRQHIAIGPPARTPATQCQPTTRDHPHRSLHRHGQHVPRPQLGVRLVCRLAVDPDRAARHQPAQSVRGTHETGAPQPFVQPLPVAIFLSAIGFPSPATAPPYRRQHGQRGERAANPAGCRRCGRGMSAAGAAASAWPAPAGHAASAPGPAPAAPGSPAGAAPPADSSALMAKRDASPDGRAAGPRRARNANSPAIFSAISSRNSIGPAATQPAAAAKPAGQPGWSRRHRNQRGCGNSGIASARNAPRAARAWHWPAASSKPA